MALEAWAIAGSSAFPLREGEPHVLPATDLMIVLRDAHDAPIRLDGRVRHSYRAGDSRIVSIDLSRSTGFHHLHVAPGFDFWFGTEDAKLGLEGIVAMLGYLRDECLSWTGQLLFSDGSYMRDPHVMYGWLDQRAETLLTAAHAIAAHPRRSMIRMRYLTPRTGHAPALDLSATIAFLRRRPKEHLEEAADGTIRVGDRHYFPRKVVASRFMDTIDTPANRRVVWMLAQFGALVEEVSAELRPSPERDRCSDWSRRCRRLLLLSPLARLFPEAARHPLPEVASSEEMVDPRYRAVFDGARSLGDLSGWSATRDRRPIYSYVALADEIYQAFVATVIAECLELQSNAAAVGLIQPAFSGQSWDLYLNVVPPRHVLRSWRSYSRAPDRYRPDVLLRNRSSGYVAIGDAKYRTKRSGASESSRSDLLAYMAAFGLERSMIFFPATKGTPLVANYVEAQGRLLAEVPVAPGDTLRHFLRDNLPAIIDRVAAPPPWTD